MFEGETELKAIDAYNNWAKDKPLGKDVIIHSHMKHGAYNMQDKLIIVVFFDENLHASWVGKTE
jgi:hypothetical protein